MQKVTCYDVTPMPPLKTAVCLAVLASAATAVPFADGGMLSGQKPRTPPYVYPFPSYPNSYAQSLPDLSGQRVFLNGVAWPTNGTATLWGTTSNGLANLCVSDNSVWGGSWALRSVDGDTWNTWPDPNLSVSSLSKDVYEIHLTTAASGSLPSFWVAWPTNATVPDRSSPAGAVHGEIAGGTNVLRMHVWGCIYDALQAGLQAGPTNGVASSRLKVDSNWVAFAPDAAGSFDVSVAIRHRPDGVHTVNLYAADTAHSDLFSVDSECVSEYGWPLPQAPGPNPGNGGCIVDTVGSMPSGPSGIAVAKPRLNTQGLLILDGSESIGATFYHWTIEDLSSGVTYIRDGVNVETEDLPAGGYSVTLDCSGNVLFWPPTDTPNATTSFFLIIPPRVYLAAREVDGALHIRWTPEVIGGKWNWCFYLSGHVFDEIGTTVFNQTVTNLETWVTVNGTRLNLTLDATGSFLTRYVAGVQVAPVYDLILNSKTLDDGKEYTVDSLHETELTIFPPWLRYYFR